MSKFFASFWLFVGSAACFAQVEVALFGGGTRSGQFSRVAGPLSAAGLRSVCLAWAQ